MIIVFDLLFSFIGWVCLYVWYRDGKKVEKVKNDKYAGAFHAAGKVFFLNLIAGVGAAAMIGFVFFVLTTWIYESLVK